MRDTSRIERKAAMSLLRSVILAFAMFSKIPMPRVVWTKGNMRYLLVAFPFVGMVIGLLLWGWLLLCNAFEFGTILFAAGLTFIPVAITGGIHLDGFCDTVDALSSHASPDKKREILKDPHTGAFAVIYVCAYLLAYFALCTEMPREAHTVWFIGIVHMMIRTTVGFGVLHFPAVNPQGLFYTISSFSHKTGTTIGICCIFALCAAVLTLIGGLTGIVVTIITVICSIYVYFMSKKQFGGMSGDLSGYWLQLTELVALTALVFIGKAVTL